LEEEFELNRYPEASKIENLCAKLDLPFQKISIWFQNKRASYKKRQSNQRK
jgi:hypothetical protein